MKRLSALMGRYQTRHVSLDLDKGQLDPLSPPDARIASLRLNQGQLDLEIETTAREVMLGLGGFSDIRRTDGAAATIVQLSLPAPLRALQAEGGPKLTLDGRVYRLRLPGLKSGLWQARAGFASSLARSLPMVAAWFFTRDPHYRQRVKARLGLSTFTPAQMLRPGFLGRPTRGTQPVTILMPVYNAFDVLAEALDRVARHTTLSWRMVLVEDCSTDERVRPMVRDWAAQQGDRVTLLENLTNLGFVASVNRGFAHILDQTEGEGPVILLNSDAMVPPDWDGRLTGPFQDESVATVTPMSNDAEILSVPRICAPTHLSPGQALRIDARAAAIGPAVVAALPTGVGFCMAIARPWLRRAGLLDTAFGRGYGEEVDFCRRILQLGGRHVGLPSLFVEHRGGQSFGSAAKAKLIEQNGAIISARYPGFDQEVQDFILTDPLATPRMALALAYAASLPRADALPVYIAHAQGGGADGWLGKRIADDLALGHWSVVLRVGGIYEWQLELHGPDGPVNMVAREFGVVHDLLHGIGPKRVIYSNGVGARDELALPQRILSLAGDGDRIEILFHDYFPLSPSYTLLDADNRYHGVPNVREAADQSHRPLAGSQVTSLADWQRQWRALALQAERLVVFSDSSARIVAECWPDLAARIATEPHSLLTPVPRLPAPAPGAAPVIAVLGNLGVQKGLLVVDRLGALLQREPAATLVLIGDFDPAYPAPKGVTVHGAYRVQDIEKIARRYGITHWLIPSIWPETFSFTVHEALATGLPVLAFDIGAQGDAVRAHANGHPIPFDDKADLAQLALSAFLALRDEQPRRVPEGQTA